ncbi:MAG TPA: ion channel [Bryobacteraceae bacterium]|jgi:hypothetical protein|nr:ion channel [Bryobacteraceae bacterium]
MRHKFGLQLRLPALPPKPLTAALRAEEDGNWWLAGTLFSEFANTVQNNFEGQAQLFTRAAGCYEAAATYREAALAYVDAVTNAHKAKTVHPQVIAELNLLASFCYRQISDSFGTASYLSQAANAFERLGKATVVISDRIPPLPIAAGAFTFAGECHRHAAEAALNAGDLSQASFYFWLAGNMHLKQGHGYHAAISFRRAISMCARQAMTLDQDSLRRILPLTQQERDDKVDVLNTMETAAHASYIGSRKLNPHFPVNFVEESTAEFIISAFELFSRELAAAGNRDESIRFGALAAEHRRRRYLRNRKWVPALAYGFWRITSKYGTDYVRWFISLIVVASSYAWIYYIFKLVKPLRDFTDPFYFSVVTMTTVGYGDILPAGNWGKMVACSEIVFGLAMFGVLVGIISGRVIRS